MIANWLEGTLNNFRQNSQGGSGELLIADLTVELANLGDLCRFAGGELLLAHASRRARARSGRITAG